MIYKILDFYKKNCSTYNYVFNEMKLTYFCFVFTPFITMALVIIAAIVFKNVLIIDLFILYLIPFIGLFSIVNKKAKKIVSKKYLNGKPVEGRMWSSTKVLSIIKDLKKKSLIDFLKQNHVNINELELKKLSDLLNEEAKKTKIKFPLIPSFFAAIFISLCNNFFSCVYKNINDINTAIKFFGIASLFLGLSIASFIILKFSYYSILDDVFNNDNKKMLYISNILDDVIHDLRTLNKFSQ